MIRTVLNSTQAVYYDCRESDRLEYTSPEEAIVELFDVCYDWEGDLTDEEVAKHCPVTVLGHAPAVINSNYVYSCAETAVDRFEESLCEDFGDPDGDSDVLSYTVKQNLREKIFDMFSEAAKTMTPWLCETVEKQVYTAEEICAILRREQPEWFDKDYCYGEDDE